MSTSTDDALACVDDPTGAPDEPVSMHASCCILLWLLPNLRIMVIAMRSCF